MNNDIIKIAAIQLKKPNDIVKTAGILRMLKNKIWSLFNSDQARDVQKMVDQTSNIKPLLGEAYKLIKKTEAAINDLDLADYNTNIGLLKEKITELNDALNAFEMLAPEMPKQEGEPPKKDEEKIPPKEPGQKEENPPVNEKELSKPPTEIGEKQKETIEALKNLPNEKEKAPEAEKKPPEIAKIDPSTPIGKIDLTKAPRIRAKEFFPGAKETYEGIETLSQLGVGKDDIIINRAGPKDLFASFAEVATVYGGENAEAIIDMHVKIGEEGMKKVFYDKIPFMKIEKVDKRELRPSGEPKSGFAEVRVVSDFEPLPEPYSYYKVKAAFRLVDTRTKADDPLKLVIYTQNIFAVRNEKTEQTYVKQVGKKKMKKE